ncbi:MAG: DUF177 domain-containing protein [Peptococcaceae bacterium]|nr:DUF177 domain-containing protein [Peptococcaceae bacterium]
MIRLDVAQIKRSPGDFARYELAVDLPPITFSGEKITFAGPVKTNLTVTNTGETLTIHGSAGGKLELSCSRCLQPFDYDYMVSIDEEYSLLPTGEANEELQTFTRDYIDLTPAVINSIFLGLPMKAVCTEDCQGLCSVCGANLNKENCGCALEEGDPRFSVLKKLLKKDKK